MSNFIKAAAFWKVSSRNQGVQDSIDSKRGLV